MGESSYFLPSEVARLVLGYIKSEGYTNTCKAFVKECVHLSEYVTLMKKGREFPLSVAGFTLSMMLDEYARLKLHETTCQTGQTNSLLLWKQLESIVEMLKHGDPDKKRKAFTQSANQSARTRRQMSEAKSPQKTQTSLRQIVSSSRPVVHKCNGQVESSTMDQENTHIDPDSKDAGRVNLSVPDIESTESSKRLQTLLRKNSPNPKSLHYSSSDSDIQSRLHKFPHQRNQSSSAINNKGASEIFTVQSNCNNNCTFDSNETVANRDSKQECKKSTQETSLSCLQGSTRLQDSLKKTDIVEQESSSSNVNPNTNTAKNVRVDVSETVTETQTDVTPMSNNTDSSHSVEEKEKTSGKPELHEITNSNTCDSWLNGAPGIKGGDNLLAKFGMQQTSSTDSSDHEIASHMSVPVTPSKSKPIDDAGLITPVKQLQTTELLNKSPRRKKPKTPHKRHSDIDNKTAASVVEQLKDELTQDRVSEVIEPLLHNTKLCEKIAEISTVVLGKKSQNKSHHKSGESHHKLTAEELETITASQSLEEILETESFGHDLNLDLSDPVFEGLFKLFGTDKEAFHENLRREKQKTEVMEAEVEELEKSIHEEMVACGNLMNSQKDEGYETQRAQSMDGLYNSPRPSCSSQTAEISSPVSQPCTPQHHSLHTSFTSSPCDSRKQPAVSLQGQGPGSSPIHPHTPLSSQTDLFSPASHVTQPFSPALTEDSLVNQTIQPSTPSQQSTKAFSPKRSETLGLQSPSYQNHVTLCSPVHLPSSPHIIHQNPPDSPDELPSTTNRVTPLPCSPLVKSDFQPSTPHMVQKYSTPFTPQSKHKTVMAAGTVRHLFSPQVYSPGTQKNARVMIQTNLANGVPAPIQEVEVSDSSSGQLSLMNYTNFVSGVTSSDNRSTPIDLRAQSVFNGPELTTIDNTIGCISLPPSQSSSETPSSQKRGKGKKGKSGKENQAVKPVVENKVQQGAYSTLIGLLNKQVNVPTAVVQPLKPNPAMSMPVLTEETEAHTVVLNAAEDDIHNNTISILSPGGQNYVEVPILHCDDNQQVPTDIVSEAMSQSEVGCGDDTVCLWSKNLNTSTQLSVLSPPDSITSVPGSGAKPVLETGLRKDLTNSKKNVNKDTGAKSLKKKLDLESVDSNKMHCVESSVVRDRNEEFVCYPGEVLTAEPVNLKPAQRKVFMKNLNFGPHAGNTVGSLMPSRKVARGSAKAPFARKKSSEFTTATVTSATVNVTNDIKYRKIMPKVPVSVVFNAQSADGISEKSIKSAEITSFGGMVLLPGRVCDNEDSDTISCGSWSPKSVKILSPSKSSKISKRQSDENTVDCEVSKNSNIKAKKKESAVQSKVTQKSRNKKEKEISDKKKKNITKAKTPQKVKTDKEKVNLENKPNKGTEKRGVKEQKFEPTEDVKTHSVQPLVTNSAVNSSSSTLIKTPSKVEGNTKKNSKKKKGKQSLKDEKCGKSNGVLGSVSKEEILKRVKKKNEEQLKVKIISSKGRKTSDKLGQIPKSRTTNKLFTKSSVIDNANSLETVKTDSSDDDITLKVLKKRLHKVESKTSKSTARLKKGAGKNENLADDKLNKKDKEDAELLTNLEYGTCPHTPLKKKATVSDEVDTPSKEQVLEKLGLTPKKNAQDILESMQSPTRTNIIDLLVQITPKGNEYSPSKRKRNSNVKQANILKSPKSNKTPAKRLFTSPEKKVLSPSKDRLGPVSLKAKCEDPYEGTDGKPSKAKHKSPLKINKEAVGTAYAKAKFNGDTREKVSETKDGSCKGNKVTVLGKEPVSSTANKGTVDSLKRETKKVIPLKIKDLFKNTKIAFDGNKETKGGQKRPRDNLDQESEMEEKRVKPSKKARNSLDLSVLDYEKMMSKLSKIHK